MTTYKNPFLSIMQKKTTTVKPTVAATTAQAAQVQTIGEKLQERMDSAGYLKAGNVGDISKVIWPFFFTFTAPELAPNTGSNGSFTVTQEAAFIWVATSKVVFKKTPVIAPPGFRYDAINSLDGSEDLNNAPGLFHTFRDAQSSRQFHGQPEPVDNIGCAEFPSALPTPQLFLPNSTIECIFQNSHATNIYVPWITMFGYRVRLDEAQNILSTIS